jgi:hypothetical protein
LAAAIAFAKAGDTDPEVDQQLAGSASLLWDFGLNLTLALGTRDNTAAGRDESRFFYTKIGYRAADWCPLGTTSLSLDYGQFKAIELNGDDAGTLGLQMVQDLEEWGSEAYLGYRYHSLDRTGVNYDNINALMMGMRVKF